MLQSFFIQFKNLVSNSIKLDEDDTTQPQSSSYQAVATDNSPTSSVTSSSTIIIPFDGPVGEAVFDPYKCICTSVRDGNSLVHSSGGRGYGMTQYGITHGCYKWKVCPHLHLQLYFTQFSSFSFTFSMK